MKQALQLAQEAGAFFESGEDVYILPEHCFERFVELANEPLNEIIADLGKLLELQSKSEETAIDMIKSAVLAEREACAKVCEQGTGEAVQSAALEILLKERKRIAAAIRARGK